MKRTFNLAVIITAVLAMGTVAFAVAGTSRSPQPTDVPVMVTDRAADVATVVPASGATGSGIAASGTAASGRKTNTSGASAGGSKPSASTASASKSGGSSRKKTNSAKRTGRNSKSGGGSGSGGSSTGSSDDGEDFEVVKPPVRDDDEHASDYNRNSEGSATDGGSTEGD